MTDGPITEPQPDDRTDSDLTPEETEVEPADDYPPDNDGETVGASVRN